VGPTSRKGGRAWRTIRGPRRSGQGITTYQAANAQELRLCQETVRTWRKRFNRQGLAGLQEAPRLGRPATYTPEQVSAVIATSLTKPQAVGRPFASWTLDRVAAYLQEVKGIPIKRSRIDELLLRERWRWRTQETCFGARLDPAFTEKGGSSRPATPRHRRVVSSCAWMRGLPNAPRAFRGGS
jgi:transposase